MSKVEVELNLRGINELMKSREVEDELERLGNQVAARAGEGYAVRVHQANWIAIANVYAETDEAKRDNMKNNTLLKAVN